jgi:uncharacterized protein (DUF2237 family)
MQTDDWKGQNLKLRLACTRFAVHGFYGNICTNRGNHELDSIYICAAVMMVMMMMIVVIILKE